MIESSGVPGEGFSFLIYCCKLIQHDMFKDSVTGDADPVQPE